MSIVAHVSDGDGATIRDEALRLEQTEGAAARGWRQQWDRIVRWHARIADFSAERVHDRERDDNDDEFYAFFLNCYHLKDWLAKDTACTVSREDAEAVVNASDALEWCGDITNASKHLYANVHTRRDRETAITSKTYDLTLGPGMPTTIAPHFTVKAGDQSRDAMELADACVNAWRTALERWGLLRPEN